MRTRALLWALPLLAASLAGCGGGGGDGAPRLDVTDTTGGIRGLVVDTTVTPVEGATVRLHTGAETLSDEAGLFFFTGLDPGTYFLTVQKPGYVSGQASAPVAAGVADPDLVKVVLERIAGFNPYLETFKMAGFYECAFALPFITDGCDFAYRTVWDEYNNTQGSPPPGGLPRTVQRFHNTEFYDAPPSVMTLIQEAFWDNPDVTAMMVSVDETPIDNACDCSPSYLSVVDASPTYGRLDGDSGDGIFNQTTRVAARGFLPFTNADQPLLYGLNHEFVILTTFFHNWQPPEGWTFEARDSYPVPT